MDRNDAVVSFSLDRPVLKRNRCGKIVCGAKYLLIRIDRRRIILNNNSFFFLRKRFFEEKCSSEAVSIPLYEIQIVLSLFFFFLNQCNHLRFPAKFSTISL